MQKQFGFILLILSISSFSFPSQKDKSESQLELKHIIQQEFESSFGKGWQFSWNLNSTPHRIFGKSISQDFDANDPITSEYAARDFIFNYPSLQQKLLQEYKIMPLHYLECKLMTKL